MIVAVVSGQSVNSGMTRVLLAGGWYWVGIRGRGGGGAVKFALVAAWVFESQVVGNQAYKSQIPLRDVTRENLQFTTTAVREGSCVRAPCAFISCSESHATSWKNCVF